MPKEYEITQNFVTFYSPGTFVNEQTSRPIESWDVHEAVEMARGIVERYNARPFGFRFTTHGRKLGELNASEIDRSPMHYLGGEVQTLAQIEARNDPADRILIGNMKRNDYGRVIVNQNSWKCTLPLLEGDVIVPFSGFIKETTDATT